MDRSSWPIVVGGCYRSGTSLVRRLLNAHPRIHCGPEVKFFRDFYGDYFEDPLHHLRFTTTARTLVDEGELLEVLGAAFVTLQERSAARMGKPRWADKNPDNVLYLERWQRLLGERWLFIHVVRNPLDTLASIKEVRFPLSIPSELDARIGMYRRYTKAALRFGMSHPDRYFRLRYEHLVQAPESTVGTLMKWLDEEFDQRQLNFNAPSVIQAAGLEDPKIADTTQVHADSVGRWRSLLGTEEVRTIWSRTRDLEAQIDPDFDVLPTNQSLTTGSHL